MKHNLHYLNKTVSNGSREMWKEVRGTSRKMMNVSSEFIWTVSTLPNPSSHTMAMGLTQSLTEMSLSYLSLSKG
jgi:hypothetical protein